MSRSVGSGPMPHEDRAAVPAPVTPSTFRKRRRSRESVISIVTDATVAGHFALHVTAHAPSHPQRRDLLNLRHALHVAVTGRARLGAKRLDVAHVGEAYEAGKRMDANPLRGFPLAPRGADLLDLGLMRRRGAVHLRVTPHARLERRDAWLTRHRRRIVTVHARDLVLSRVDVVAEEDRLARSLEVAGVADDGSLIPRCS